MNIMTMTVTITIIVDYDWMMMMMMMMMMMQSNYDRIYRFGVIRRHVQVVGFAAGHVSSSGSAAVH